MDSMTCWMSIYLTCICPELSTSLCYSAIGAAASITVIVIIIDSCRQRTTTTGRNFKVFNFLKIVLRNKQTNKKTAQKFKFIFHKLNSFFYTSAESSFCCVVTSAAHAVTVHVPSCCIHVEGMAKCPWCRCPPVTIEVHCMKSKQKTMLNLFRSLNPLLFCNGIKERD